MVRKTRFGVAWGQGHAAVLATIALAFSAGCRSPDERLRTEAGPDTASGRLEPRRVLLGSSVEGRPVEGLEFGQGDDVVLIMATIHGSETAGTPLVRRLGDYLTERPALLEGRRVLLIPVANPDGMALGVRHNARGVDLNRNFPASNYRSAASHGQSAMSEPESIAIHRALETYQPDRIVSIHQPLSCIDYDGPAEDLARAMAAHTDLRVEKLGGRPGSLGSYAGITLGIPIITVELPAAATALDGEALWRQYGEMLLAAVQFAEPRRGGNQRATD
jgi:protein MpaA